MSQTERPVSKLPSRGVADSLWGVWISVFFTLIVGIFVCVFRLLQHEHIHLGGLNLENPPKYAHGFKQAIYMNLII